MTYGSITSGQITVAAIYLSRVPSVSPRCPATAMRKGKLAGFFQQGEEEPVEVKGEFDIKDEVAQS